MYNHRWRGTKQKRGMLRSGAFRQARGVVLAQQGCTMAHGTLPAKSSAGGSRCRALDRASDAHFLSHSKH